MNKMILTILVLMIALLGVGSCGDGSSSSSADGPAKDPGVKANPSSYDPHRGEGKYNEANITAGPLNPALADKGKAIAATKCNSCHKMTDERLVGPGWKGVTERRTLPWLMNFITNPDPMIDKDPELQAQLEICLVRMPNQNLLEDEARSIVEYMRQNDGVK